MLKVRMVYSNMDYAKSQISDEGEDRQNTFYSKQLMVEVNEDEDISLAYRMDNDEFCFGYEFVKKSILREINFGESDIVGEQFTVAGKEDVRKGFKICKHCGKVQPEKGAGEHSYTCRAKNPSTATEDLFEEFLFLYREFKTEALRILVPATTLDSSRVRQESFIAAFMLGMKQYFGNVEHLRATLSEVPITNADFRKQYLVIYDSVPGGTGYLKQLMLNEHSLVDIFEKALDVLEKCGCKADPQKDGCYHCLYAYRQSQSIGQISRSTAIRLLKQILSGKENLHEIPKLGDVPANSLFESELEREFIEALSQMGSEKREIIISKELVNNKEGYLLKVNNAIWEIEPQVRLDSACGVCVESRADFVIHPVKTEGNHRPIAVYTDGFLFHKNKVDGDTLKREAVRRSGIYRVWTLSWKDVQNTFHAQGDYATYTLLPEKMINGARMYKPTVESENATGLQPYKASPMELLVNYLANPEAERIFNVHARAYAMSMLDISLLRNSASYADWQMETSRLENALGLQSIAEFGNTIFGIWQPTSVNSHMTVYTGVESNELQKNKAHAKIRVYTLLNDSENSRTEKNEAEWNGYWQFVNMMQFLPEFAFASVTGIRQMVYAALLNIETAQDNQPTASPANEWTEILEQIIYDDTLAFVMKCIELGAPQPSVVGFELIGENEDVIAEAELAWETNKIAMLTTAQAENENAFINHGWTVIWVDDFDDILIHFQEVE